MKSPMRVESKVWGEVVHVFASPRAAVSYLTTRENSWCSVHRHKKRANQFSVITGIIAIHDYGNADLPSATAISCHELGPGESFTVPSMQWHQFSVIESGTLIEVYWADQDGNDVVSIEDIDRHVLGGCLDESP